MHVRRIVPIAAAVLLLAACGGGDGGTGPTPPGENPPPATPVAPVASATVAAGANSNDFSPREVNLKVGGTVTWTFGARPHNAIFQKVNGAPADVPVLTNGQAARTFNTVGTFPYDCTLHAGMTGTVRVQ
ncbi:MAG TPA: plastocyanin/azurin family copper-binding protein [Longimicrobiaceae bacterium]|nr:plastocyanin/azurin family copper-binding protein [Longimicrobiaceae bacterium]